MTKQRRAREYCPDCSTAVRGFKRVFCPECGALTPTAGYAGRAARLRAHPAPTKKRSRFGFSAAAA